MSISIRHMNLTLRAQEQEQARQDAQWYDRLSAEEKADRSHYWHIERKAKRGNRWILHAEFFGTKKQVADYWRKNFQGKSKQFRLLHLLAY
jgi:hypothetical protein